MSARSKSGPKARSASASHFHSTAVEKKPRRLSRVISQALSFDDADAYAAGEVGFLARALVQATMPHSDPKTNEFVRHNGHYSLSILAPKGVWLPYGRYPRLVLAYLNTEAVKRRTRHIELDHHFSRFCRFLKYLESVISYYPGVGLGSVDAGLLLKPSPTHIASRNSPMKV